MQTLLTVIAAVSIFIIIATFLLAICKANGNNRDDDEQEQYLKEKFNKSK